ncbi:hypothetical protein L6R53_03725 [Myxococcota bacterium]|nr:hypothetical protein [Myxococcota bacterium]
MSAAPPPEPDEPEPPTEEPLDGPDARGEAPPEVAPPAAICHRCGGAKRGPFVPCKACGYTPVGAERHVAWLFSEHHLDPEELGEAARRLRAGDRPDPPRTLLESARIRMGAAPLTTDARRPLDTRQLLLLGACNVLLTPLAGLAVWWGLAPERPLAARQALRITLPVLVGAALLWTILLANWRLV